jgi:hypothetical protein
MNFGTITITFGDQAENHVGMQKLGNGLAPAGFSVGELKDAKKKFESAGCLCQLINLNQNLPAGTIADEAAILVIKNAVNTLLTPMALSAKDLAIELIGLDWDKQAKMYGRVVNKRARYNLCFADSSQDPDIAAGKGTVIDFIDVSCTNKIRTILSQFLGYKASDLVAEGNWYYDVSKCFLGFHGDVERKIVIAIRVGDSFPLHYQWYQNNQAVGKKETINLEGGDMYVMSEKATGFDWKKRKIFTLRHAAGLNLPQK